MAFLGFFCYDAKIMANKKNARLKESYLNLIRQFLQGKGYAPLKGSELEERLSVPEQHAPTFQKALSELVNLGEIRVTKGRFSLAFHPSTLAIGVIRVHPRGFGFLLPDERALFPEEIFVPKHLTNGAVDGDHVEVLINEAGLSEKGPEGEVYQILKRGRSHLAGTITHILSKEKALAYAPLIGFSSPVTVSLKGFSLKIGDRIVIHVSEWGGAKIEPKGEVAYHIGHISDPSCDIAAAIEEFNLDNAFSPEIIKEAESFGKSVSANELKDKNRQDLRHQIAITIDPETARDFDDALSLTVDEKGHYHLGVHIADVTHYVKPGSLLDIEAKKRCNSVYFPGAVLPMLPERLSNELCSLKPNVNRLAASILMEFSPDGVLLGTKITKSMIKSRKRFSYEEAKAVLDGKVESPYAPLLKQMVDLCLALKRERYKRGSIEFSLPEVAIIVDEKGAPEKLRLIEYDISHQLVEEFMLKANEVVATHLSNAKKPLTYRIHESPSPENLENFGSLASLFGFKVSSPPTGEELQKLFDEAKESPFGRFLATSFIKSLKLAIYSCNNIGHYGLKLDHYTHFTSPIRRYIDLIVHRVLFNETKEGDDLEKIALECSEKERLAAKAENSVKLLKKLRLLLAAQKKNPHAIYEAVITSVKPFGFAFEVSEFLVEGFIHISEIGDDYFEFEEEKKILRGRHEGEPFATGKHIEVRLLTVNLITLEMKWTLEQEEKPRKSKRRK